MKGIDWGYGTIPASIVKEAGYGFICRYLSLSRGKNLTKEEYLDAKAAGLDVIVVWETVARACLRGFNSGKQDAETAQSLIAAIAGNNCQCIYFACDDDFNQEELTVIKEYFKGINEVLHLPNIGVYGGYNTVKYILDQGLATFAWQTYAWSHGKWDLRVCLKQIQNGIPTLNYVQCDTNEAVHNNFGQF